MNGMERKVAQGNVALECNGEKRKPPAAGFVHKTIHGLHLRREIFVDFTGNNVDLKAIDRIPDARGDSIVYNVSSKF